MEEENKDYEFTESINLAEEYRQTCRYNDAIEILKKALSNAWGEKYKCIIFYEIAVSYDAWKKHEEAIEFYENFLAVRDKVNDKENELYKIEDGLYNIAIIYSEKLQEYEKAIGYYDRYLEKKNDDADACFRAGFSYTQLGKSEKAVKYYRKALNIELESDIKNQDKIIEYARAILKIEPDNTDMLNTIGVAYKQLGNFENAIQNLEKTLKIEPDNKKAHVNLGDIYNEVEDYDKAIDFYEKCLKIEPDQADALIGRGLIFGKQKEYDKAIADYEKAYLSYKNGFFIEIGHILTALTELAFIYDNKTEEEKAIQAFSRELDIAPSSDEKQRLDYSEFLSNNEKYVKPKTFYLFAKSFNRKEREEERLKDKLEAEKQLFSDLKHTFGNILGSAPIIANNVLSFIKKTVGKHYHDAVVYKKNINYTVNLVSIFNQLNKLIEMFDLYRHEPEKLIQKWKEDSGGDHNLTYLFALIFRHVLSYAMFSETLITQAKRLLKSEDKNILAVFREQFLNEVLSLEISSQNAYQLLGFIETHIPLLDIDIDDSLYLNANNIRFNFLFICISELIYNALKYTDGQTPIKIIWRECDDGFIFSCANTFDSQKELNRPKGLSFIRKMCSTIEIGFKPENLKPEGSIFKTELKIKKAF